MGQNMQVLPESLSPMVVSDIVCSVGIGRPMQVQGRSSLEILLSLDIWKENSGGNNLAGL